MTSNVGRSKEFFELIKSIGESKSKQEEDRIIIKEVDVLRERMGQPKITVKKMKEYLIRMIYVEMLGHEAPFGHISAIKMINDQANFHVKRIGYLAVCLCLHPDHELMLLLVNSLQKDLKSSNHIEVALALHAICKLVNKDLIPAVQPLVMLTVEHRHANVRKKAAMTLQRFFHLDTSFLDGHSDLVRKLLCDREPSVMGATLNLVYDLIEHDAAACKDLVSSLVSILRQVIEHRLPRDFDYHRMPAPWAQIKILQSLALLGELDADASQEMYETLGDILRKSDVGSNIGFAIVYECVRTVTSIYPNPGLLAEAAKCVTRFVTSENHNLKYLGITALASIVQIDQHYAVEHQMVVIECLEDSDETIRRKTLDLLYRMTNSENVVVIVDKLVASLQSTIDTFLRQQLVLRVCQLAEQFAPDTYWFIDTVNEVYRLADDLVPHTVSTSLLHLIASEDEEDDVRAYAVDTYAVFVDNPTTKANMLRVGVWLLGEFGYLSANYSIEELLEILCNVMEQPLEEGSNIRSYATTAIAKLFVHTSTVSLRVADLIHKFQSSVDVDLQQRSYELIAMLEEKKTLEHVFRHDKELQIDEELSFLQGYVDEALANGAQPYSEEMEVGEPTPKADTLSYEPYQKPKTHMDLAPIETHEPEPEKTDGIQFRSRAKKVWGPTGYNDGSSKARKASPSPVSVPAASTVEPRFQQRTSQQSAVKQTPSRQEESEPPSEKQKFAAALFSGVGGSQSRSGAHKGKRSSKPKVALQSRTSASAPAAKPSKASQYDGAPVSPSTTSHDVLDLLDFSNLNVQSSQGAAASTMDSVESLFGSEQNTMDLGSKSTGALDSFDMLATEQVSLPHGHDTLSVALREQIEASKRSSGYDTVIAENDTLRVSTYTVYGPHGGLLVLFLGNKGQSNLSPVNVRLNLPRCFSITGINGEPRVNANRNNVQIPSLEAESVAKVLVSLGAAQSFAAQESLTAEIVYANGSLPLQVDLNLGDIVRPLQVDTNQFGGLWKRCTCETKLQVKSSAKSNESVAERLAVLNVKSVQAIGSENIFGGYLLTPRSPLESPLILIHIKVQPLLHSVLVRTNAQALTVAAASIIKQALQ